MTVKRIRDSKTPEEERSLATLATLYAKPERSRSATGQQRIREAYVAVFEGRGSREDADIVYVDLAKHSGYLNTTPPELPAMELKYAEGQRSVFGRIIGFINPAPAGIRALVQAVQEEQLHDRDYGEIS